MTWYRISLAALVIAAACSKPESGEFAPQPEKNARLASADATEAPVTPGDCVEARRRAANKPDLVVDRIPSIIRATPAALQHVPRSALRKDGSAEIKVDVLVDTLGKADMKTFRIVTASSPWLATNIKSVIGKWRFEPAQLAGCKVPRVFHFMASASPRRSR